MIHEVSFNIFCKHETHEQPVYRLWCNGTLLTERRFIWETHKNYLNELVTVNIDENTRNNIVVENISKYGQFKVDDVQIVTPNVNTTFAVTTKNPEVIESDNIAVTA